MELVDELSTLLQALGIPLLLQSPTDLTPSLLLAILECILSSRLPISLEFRERLSSKSRDADNAKIQCMKIFLGVLETDILKKDVGLGQIDPFNLANGNWDEVVYVGEVLCWVGKEIGITGGSSPRPNNVELLPWKLTPSTGLETSTSQLSSSSPLTADTSTDLHGIEHLRSFSTPSRLSSLLSPLPRRPQPPYAPDVSPVQLQSPLVRYSGYIQPADEEAEINSFESYRSGQTSNSGSKPDINDESAEAKWDTFDLPSPSDPDPQARTVFLLQQRAFLLCELARYHEGG